MATTVNSLITDYAERIAKSVGLTSSAYQPTAAGLALLLEDTAGRLSSTDQTAVWLRDAADDLNAIARLGDDGPKTQELLDAIDNALFQAAGDLELV